MGVSPARYLAIRGEGADLREGRIIGRSPSFPGGDRRVTRAVNPARVRV